MTAKKQIIVIDDETDLCWLIKSFLEATDLYEVSSAHNGNDGEKLCIEKKPDLILLDFVMPQKNGNEVLKFLKANEITKKTPVILMSGLGEMVYQRKHTKWQWLPNNSTVRNNKEEVPEVLKWKRNPENIAKDLGVDNFIAKPFGRQVLLDIIEDIFKERDNKNQQSANGEIEL